MSDITTKSALIAAIKKARMVFVTPRFGVCDAVVKITKKDAMALAERLHDNATPREYEMPCGVFAHIDEDGDLFFE